MRKTRIAVFTVLALAALTACEGPEPNNQDAVVTIKQAATYVTSPSGLGNGVVTIGVGSINGNSNTVIFWSNYQCSVVPLVTPLSDELVIDASSTLGTETQVLASGQSKGFQCNNLGRSYVMSYPIAQNGWRVTVYGSAYGGDYMNCSGGGSGPVTCFGQGGNDLMESWQPKVWLFGGKGDDKIRFNGTPNVNTKIYGDEGIDCLQAQITASSIGAEDCGPHPSPNPCIDPVAHPETCDRSTGVMETNCQWTLPYGACNW
jgi:hypothetical protein